MAEVKRAVTKERTGERTSLFTKENYMLMALGAVIIIIGMFLMGGGKNQDPNTFDEKLVYSTTRITIAPIVILLGFVVEIYAIFRKPAAGK